MPLRLSVMSYVKALATAAAVIGLLLWFNPADDAGRAANAVLLLTVLITGRIWGTGPAIASAGVCTLAYLYYLLPPIGFAISIPSDWAALGLFLITAIIGGSLLAQVNALEKRRQYFEAQYWQLYNVHSANIQRSSSSPNVPDTPHTTS